LFWRVFVTNAMVLALAFAGLVAAPIRVSVPVATGEFVVLGAGLVALLIVSLLMLRPAFRPLDELAETMRRHDPLSPGTRARIDGDPDVAALAHTFNEMLKRLEPVALLLMFIGALNWGIVGITNGDTNVLSSIFGSGTLLNVVYVLVGVSALVFVPRLMEALHIRGAHPRGV